MNIEKLLSQKIFSFILSFSMVICYWTPPIHLFCQLFNNHMIVCNFYNDKEVICFILAFLELQDEF